MFKKLVPVTKEKHSGKKIKKIESFEFAKGTHLASIMVNEFYRAASTYPIVFLEEPETGDFRPMVLLGLAPNENLFINEDNRWEASYVPAIIRRYPFALAKTNEENRFVICIDEESELVNDTEGEPIFNEDGEAGEMMNRVRKYLGELHQMELLTKNFCTEFKTRNLFTPLNMRVRAPEGVQNITGCYVIHEQRLSALPDADFLEFRKKNYLPAIYAHLTSLAQMERLLQLKDKKQKAEKPDAS